MTTHTGPDGDGIRPNLLFISAVAPDPPVDGGRIRTLAVLRGVARHYAVTLVAFAAPPFDAAAEARLRALCADVSLHPLPPHDPRGRSTWRKLTGIADRYPAGLAQLESAAVHAAVQRLGRERQFAVVHLDHIGMAHYLDDLPQLPVVLTHHNVEALNQARQLALRPDRLRPSWWGPRLEQGRWFRFERDVSRRVGALAVVSADEAAFFRRHAPQTPVVIVPNGVDLDQFTPQPEADGPPTLLFTGKLSYEPNIDGVGWFADAVWPLVRARVPAARWHIVGRSPVPAVRALADRPGVAVFADVPDIRPYFAAATVYVVPLRSGGGTRLKILEAAAAGRALVSTTIGCEGLDAVPGEHLLVADDPVGLADAVVALLTDAPRRRALAARARDWVAARYDWSAIIPRQLDAYRLAMERAR